MTSRPNRAIRSRKQYSRKQMWRVSLVVLVPVLVLIALAASAAQTLEGASEQAPAPSVR
jgi:hypothetical protein